MNGHRPFLILTIALLAAPAAVLGDDWPQFRGPHRDGISAETGLLRQWPEGGPKVLWSLQMDQGYSAAAIVGVIAVIGIIVASTGGDDNGPSGGGASAERGGGRPAGASAWPGMRMPGANNWRAKRAHAGRRV